MLFRSPELEAFAQAARASAWSSAAADAPDLSGFDAVVAFGDDATLAAIRERAAPGARFVGYGSRASAGYVTRETLATREQAELVARGAARDLVLYETEGCLSLHVLFAERGAEISLAEFGSLLSGAVQEANVEFPSSERGADVAAAIAQHRDLAAFRAAAGRGSVFANDAADYAVIVEHPHAEPPQFLPRTLGVVAVDSPEDALAYVRRHGLRLEGFALSSAREDAVRAAVACGAVRLARFGELQHPPLAGDHGGLPRITEFIRWIDREL